MVYTYRQKISKILHIALPSGANSLLDIVVLALGMFFMGRFSQEHIVAVSIGLQYMMMFFTINAVFYMGTSAQISRYFGAKDSLSASKAFFTLLVLCCVCGIPLIGVGLAFIDSFIDWMELQAQSAHLCKTFLTLVVFTLPGMLLKNIIASAFAAIGDTLSIFIVRIFSTILCIAINVFLIFSFQCEIGNRVFHIGMGLDIVGAAVANIIITYLELLLFIGLVFKRGQFFTKSLQIAWKYFYTALKIGIPAGLERLLTLGSLVLTTKFLASFGSVALAGSQIGSRIEAFAFMPGFGFMVAAMALTGQNLGAHRVDLAHDFNKTILQISSIIMGILGILMVVFGAPLSRIFLDSDEVVRVSMMYLVAVGFSQVPLIWVFVLDGVLRGAGITKMSLCINACSIWIFRIAPMWFIVHYGYDIMYIFACIFVETYIRAGIFYYAYFKGIWKKPGKEL